MNAVLAFSQWYLYSKLNPKIEDPIECKGQEEAARRKKQPHSQKGFGCCSSFNSEFNNKNRKVQRRRWEEAGVEKK